MRLSLTKHHGLGNDFLVLFDDQPLPGRRRSASWPGGCATAAGASAPTASSSASPRPGDGRRPRHGAAQRRRLAGPR